MAKASMKREWKMPKWMEPCRSLFVNTGGNSIEDLVNWQGNANTNVIMAMLSISAESQVQLLELLHTQGFLAVDEPAEGEENDD